MALRLWIQAPTLTSGPLNLYETGAPGRLYPDMLSSITRKVDIYTGRDSIASAGTLTTVLDNRDGLFSPDGVFAPRWRDAVIVAQIDANVVFIGRAEKTGDGTAGVKATIQWRDLVDDFLAQQIPGAGDDMLVAQTDLTATLQALGVPTGTTASQSMWLPRETTTLRKWLSPVLAALGLTLDWTATARGDEIDAGFRLQTEATFGNGPQLPRFIDAQLVGDARWDSGRSQVFNLWSGQRRFFDAADARFDSEDVEALGDPAAFGIVRYSREHFGERKARLDLSQVQDTRERIIEIANDVINRRAWPHPRGDFTLRGAEASALRIGDGLVTDFALGIAAGRGLSRVWRVQGRTVDLIDETTKLYCEVRDGRDADYLAWRAAGAQTEDAT